MMSESILSSINSYGPKELETFPEESELESPERETNNKERVEVNGILLSNMFKLRISQAN